MNLAALLTPCKSIVNQFVVQYRTAIARLAGMGLFPSFRFCSVFSSAILCPFV